jgi:hypothetical protein
MYQILDQDEESEKFQNFKKNFTLRKIDLNSANWSNDHFRASSVNMAIDINVIILLWNA